MSHQLIVVRGEGRRGEFRIPASTSSCRHELVSHFCRVLFFSKENHTWLVRLLLKSHSRFRSLWSRFTVTGNHWVGNSTFTGSGGALKIYTKNLSQNIFLQLHVLSASLLRAAVRTRSEPAGTFVWFHWQKLHAPPCAPTVLCVCVRNVCECDVHICLYALPVCRPPRWMFIFPMTYTRSALSCTTAAANLSLSDCQDSHLYFPSASLDGDVDVYRAETKCQRGVHPSKKDTVLISIQPYLLLCSPLAHINFISAVEMYFVQLEFSAVKLRLLCKQLFQHATSGWMITFSFNFSQNIIFIELRRQRKNNSVDSYWPFLKKFAIGLAALSLFSDSGWCNLWCWFTKVRHHCCVWQGEALAPTKVPGLHQPREKSEVYWHHSGVDHVPSRAVSGGSWGEKGSDFVCLLEARAEDLCQVLGFLGICGVWRREAVKGILEEAKKLPRELCQKTNDVVAFLAWTQVRVWTASTRSPGEGFLHDDATRLMSHSVLLCSSTLSVLPIFLFHFNPVCHTVAEWSVLLPYRTKIPCWWFPVGVDMFSSCICGFFFSNPCPNTCSIWCFSTCGAWPSGGGGDCPLVWMCEWLFFFLPSDWKTFARFSDNL